MSLGAADELIDDLLNAVTKHFYNFLVQAGATSLVAAVTYRVSMYIAEHPEKALTGDWLPKLVALTGTAGILGVSNMAIKSLGEWVRCRRKLTRARHLKEDLLFTTGQMPTSLEQRRQELETELDRLRLSIKEENL